MELGERIRAVPEVPLGVFLFVLATAIVLVTHPPWVIVRSTGSPWTGQVVLPGRFRTLYAPVAVLLSAVGGVLLSNTVAGAVDDRDRRLGVRALVALSPVGLLGLYLVAVAGYDVGASIFQGAAAIAVLGSVVDELDG